MARKKKKYTLLKTEDELRAESEAKADVVRDRSTTATEKLAQVTAAASGRRNPLAIGSELLQSVWMCSVALYGLLYGGWSPASVIVCFWFEKLTRVSLVAARIFIHRQATRKRGHFRKHLDIQLGTKDWSTGKFRNSPIGSGSLLGEFIGLSVLTEVLTLGVMVWALGSMEEWTHTASGWAFVKQEWLSKAWIIVLPLVMTFVIDTVTTLRQRSFASVKVMAIVTNRTANLILTAFLIAMWLGHYTKLHNLLVLACILIAVKTIYEISLTIFGRDWEAKMNDGTGGMLWRSDAGYAKYANEEAALRARDEEPLK
jgi:hypothetical protein